MRLTQTNWRRSGPALGMLFCALMMGRTVAAAATGGPRQTHVAIRGDEFYINGHPTYEHRAWNGHKIEGLLLNSRMVQGIFDDRNPATVQRWAYPDTGKWDAERNTREFLVAMPEWRAHGLLAFTINLQGGSPEGYSKDQPWHNSAIESDGSLRSDYMGRLERVLDRADALGMVVILGYFYFGQDERLQDEAAVIRATDNATRWLLDRRYRNVIVEINNECNVRYDHAILRPPRVHELVQRVQNARQGEARLLVSASYGGGTVPLENVVRKADFLLIHGNGVSDSEKIAEMVRRTRQVPGYSPKPILFNEDDHFNFEEPSNNFTAAVGEYASWGYFDPGKNDYQEGYQSPPVHWGLNTERKRGFFDLLTQITGASASAQPSGAAPREVTMRRFTYHGWPDSILMSNGKVEVVIVPAIGRLMQFRFAGEEDGPFWENREMDGRAPEPKSSEWGNFGGDKTWPAPQSDWPTVTGRAWPPPPAFDSMPVEARVERSAVVLGSPADPHYGIRTERRIELKSGEPSMSIHTRYTKVSGDAQRVGVWVITQLKDPVRVYAPLPTDSLFASGYAKQSDALPKDFAIQDRLLSLSRSAQTSHKVGCDGATLLWVGEKVMVRIDHGRLADAEYPDQGSSAEVYTNPDPRPYVELEMLGPLRTMQVGHSIESTSSYSLLRRTQQDPAAEARRILLP